MIAAALACMVIFSNPVSETCSGNGTINCLDPAQVESFRPTEIAPKL